LLPVPFLHRPVKPVQHLQSFRRNPGQNHAPVFGVAPSHNEAPLRSKPLARSALSMDCETVCILGTRIAQLGYFFDADIRESA
jgi:hypothetical protein